MFHYVRDLAQRHKKKLIISTGVITASYFVSKYVSSKINEFQEKLKEENFAKEQIKRRFKQTQNDCYMTFLSLLPLLTEPIYLELNVEEITRALQAKRSSKRSRSKSNSGAILEDGKPMSTIFSDDFSTTTDGQELRRSISGASTTNEKSKTQLWNDLKIQALTRFLTLIYCESLLVVFLHLQLNILSRRSYLETALKLASETEGITGADGDATIPESTSNLAEQAFLSFSWWLLNKGWIEIKGVVESNVEDVFQEINPREELSIDEFAILINKVQLKTDEFVTAGNLSGLVIPDDENLEFYLLQQTNDLEFLSDFNDDLNNTKNLKVLLAELRSYLGSTEVSQLVNLLVSVLISKNLEKFTTEDKLKLASYLAMVTKQSNLNLSDNSLDNEVLFMLNNLQELDDLSASVYSNF